MKTGKYFSLDRKIGWAELIALGALFASIYAVIESHKANSPRIHIVEQPARSYLKCESDYEYYKTRNIAIFRIANNGGRSTTFVGFKPLDSVDPLIAFTKGKRLVNPRYSLVKFRKEDILPEVLDSPSWGLESIFDGATKLILVDGEGGNLRARPTLYNIVIEPGTSQLVAFGVTARIIENKKLIDQLQITLLGQFSHGEERIMQANIELPDIGRGNCQIVTP